MTLTSALKTGPRPLRKHTCKIVLISNTLDEQEKDALKTMLTDPAWDGSAIARELNRLGHPITASSVQRHRRRDCTCVTN